MKDIYVNKWWDVELIKSVPAWMMAIGIFSTLLYGSTKIYDVRLSDISLGLLVIFGFFAIGKYGTPQQRKITILIFSLVVIIQIISWFNSLSLGPEVAEAYPKIDRQLRNMMFIPIAWWLAGNIRNVYLFWTVSGLSVLLAPWLLGGGFDEILQGISGQRIDFNIRNAQHTALFFGCVFIGMAIFTPVVFRSFTNIVVRLSWVISMFFSLGVVLMSQTRASWLAIMLTGLFYGLVKIYEGIKKKSLPRKKLFLAFPLLLLVTGIIYFSQDIISQRLASESEVINTLAKGELEDVPYTSIGIRINTWKEAIKLIQENPLFGIGGKGRSYAIEVSNVLPERIKEEYGHLHNTYLELTVEHGLIGLFLYFSLLIWLFIMLVKAYKQGKVKIEFVEFIAAFLVFWSVMNLFESYYNFWTGVLMFNIVMAGVLTMVWSDYPDAKTRFMHYNQ